MIREFGPILLAMAVLCGTCAWAQNDTDTSDTGAPTQPGPKPAFTYPDATPSLDFLNGELENSSITLGVNGGFAYASNAYSYTTQDRWLFHVAPSIKIQQFRPRLSWNLGYSGGLQTYTYLGNGSHGGNNNLYFQSATGGFLWQMTRHWQMEGSNIFTHSANPFDSYLTSVGTPTMNNPNPVSYYPLTTFEQNNAVVTITNRLTKRDILAFSGTANLRNTSNYNLVTSVPFYNLVSYGGRASYSHELSTRLSLGAEYNYNSLAFGSGQQRSGIQVVAMTVDYQLRPNMLITGWIGPQYTSTKTLLGIPDPNTGQIVYLTSYDSQWSTAAGVIFAWHSVRNSLRAGYTRQVSDGGGITATSQVNSVNSTYRRMFTTKTDLQLGFRYFDVISLTNSNRTFNTYNLNAELIYRLAKSLTATGQYSYFHQNRSNALLIGSGSNSGSYNDNLVGLSIKYTWNHPLGR